MSNYTPEVKVEISGQDKGLAGTVNRTNRELQNMERQTSAAADEMEDLGTQTDRTNNETNGLERTIGRATKALGAYLTVQSAVKALQIADDYRLQQSRLQLITESTGDYEMVMDNLRKQVVEAGAEMETTVQLFMGISRVKDEIGATNNQVLRMTDIVQKLGVISGAATQNMNAGIMQFTQSMSSGIVRAEEWNSITENIPELANAIARGMGKTVGQLRLAVLEGDVLSKDVFEALIDQSNQIDAKFEKMPDTMARAGQSAWTEFSRMLSAANETYGWTEAIASALRMVGKAAGDVADSMAPDVQLEREYIQLLEQKKNLIQGQFRGTGGQFGLRGVGDIEVGADEEEIDQRMNEILYKLAEIRNWIPSQLSSFMIDPMDQYMDEFWQSAVIDPQEKIREQKEADRIATEQHQQKMNRLLDEAISMEERNIRSSDIRDRFRKNLQDQIDGQKLLTEFKGRELFIQQDILAARQLGVDIDLDSIREQAGALYDLQVVTKKIADGAEETAKSYDELKSTIEGWSRSFADEMMSAEASFTSFANTVLQQLARIAITKATAPFFNAFADWAGDQFSSDTSTTGGGSTGGDTPSGGGSTQPTDAPSLSAPTMQRVSVTSPSIQGDSVTTVNNNAVPDVVINVENKTGEGLTMTQRDSQFDGRQLILSVVIEALNSNPKFRQQIRGVK